MICKRYKMRHETPIVISLLQIFLQAGIMSLNKAFLNTDWDILFRRFPPKSKDVFCVNAKQGIYRNPITQTSTITIHSFSFLRNFSMYKDSKTSYVLGQKLINMPFCSRARYPSYHVNSYLRQFIKDLVNNSKLI